MALHGFPLVELSGRSVPEVTKGINYLSGLGALLEQQAACQVELPRAAGICGEFARARRKPSGG
jgi:hypothetical protein